MPMTLASDICFCLFELNLNLFGFKQLSTLESQPQKVSEGFRFSPEGFGFGTGGRLYIFGNSR